MSTDSYKREIDKFGCIDLAPRPSKIKQTKRASKKCISITHNVVNHDSLPREPLNMGAISLPSTDIS